MGLRVTGLRETAARLENIGERSTKKALRALRDGAESIRSLAELWAPRDTGALESAIKTSEAREGVNRRVTIEVYVDDAVVNKYGKRVGKYATLVHEGIPETANYGKSKPGSKTHFLSDAVERESPKIAERIKAALAEALRQR